MASFTEDSRFVNWAARMGIPFEYKTGLRFTELAPGWALVNQGRPDGTPKDETLIEKYAAAMEGGAVFPSPILAETNAGFEVLDGCQRLNAAEANGQTIFNGYVIKTDNPSMRASVRICANSVLNGTSASQEWTIAKVVDVLYLQFRLSQVDCANWSGQPILKIQEEIDARDAAKWLQCQKVDVTLKPANQKAFRSAIARLFPINLRYRITNELPECVRLLQRCKANNDEAVNLLEECASFKQIQGVAYNIQFAQKVQEVMSRPEIQARLSGPRTLHPVDNAMRGLAAAVTTLRSATKGKHHADKTQAAQIIALLDECKSLSQLIVPAELWPDAVAV